MACVLVWASLEQDLAKDTSKPMILHRFWNDSWAYATSADPLQISPKLHLGQDELQEDSPLVAQELPAPSRMLFATLRSLQEHVGVLFARVRGPQKLRTQIFLVWDDPQERSRSTLGASPGLPPGRAAPCPATRPSSQRSGAGFAACRSWDRKEKCDFIFILPSSLKSILTVWRV